MRSWTEQSVKNIIADEQKQKAKRNMIKVKNILRADLIARGIMKEGESDEEFFRTTRNRSY